MNHEKAADIGAVATWLIWLLSHAADAVPLLQDISLIVAIVAGIFAARYHYIKAQR